MVFLMAKRVKTSVVDFAEFKERLHRYAEWLGMGDWKIYPEHGDADEGSNATTAYNLIQRNAVIHLAKDIYPGVTIAHLARHEISEVLLAHLDWMARCANAVTVVDEERHVVINHIECLLERLDEKDQR